MIDDLISNLEIYVNDEEDSYLLARDVRRLVDAQPVHDEETVTLYRGVNCSDELMLSGVIEQAGKNNFSKRPISSWSTQREHAVAFSECKMTHNPSRAQASQHEAMESRGESIAGVGGVIVKAVFDSSACLKVSNFTKTGESEWIVPHGVDAKTISTEVIRPYHHRILNRDIDMSSVIKRELTSALSGCKLDDQKLLEHISKLWLPKLQSSSIDALASIAVLTRNSEILKQLNYPEFTAPVRTAILSENTSIEESIYASKWINEISNSIAEKANNLIRGTEKLTVEDLLAVSKIDDFVIPMDVSEPVLLSLILKGRKSEVTELLSILDASHDIVRDCFDYELAKIASTLEKKNHSNSRSVFKTRYAHSTSFNQDGEAILCLWTNGAMKHFDGHVSKLNVRQKIMREVIAEDICKVLSNAYESVPAGSVVTRTNFNFDDTQPLMANATQKAKLFNMMSYNSADRATELLISMKDGKDLHSKVSSLQDALLNLPSNVGAKRFRP